MVKKNLHADGVDEAPFSVDGRRDSLDLALNGIYVENPDEETTFPIHSCDYIRNLVTIRTVEADHFVRRRLLEIGRYLLG